MGGVPSRRPPGGLPHGRPRAELDEVGRRMCRGLPAGDRAVGLRQVDGMALGRQGPRFTPGIGPKTTTDDRAQRERPARGRTAHGRRQQGSGTDERCRSCLGRCMVRAEAAGRHQARRCPLALARTGQQHDLLERHAAATTSTRDPRSHRRGHWFDPSIAHHRRPSDHVGGSTSFPARHLPSASRDRSGGAGPGSH
jgi:hypothetical protein